MVFGGLRHYRRLSASDVHRRHVYPIYLNGRGDSKRTDGNFFVAQKNYKRYPVSCELYEL